MVDFFVCDHLHHKDNKCECILSAILHFISEKNVIYLIFNVKKNHYKFIPQTLRATFLMY